MACQSAPLSEGEPDLTMMLPLVRAAAIAPILVWLQGQGADEEALLRAAGLPPGLVADPTRPIALRAAIDLLVRVSQTAGPASGCLVVHEDSIGDLGLLALARAGARTPRETLTRIGRGYAVHGSHEQLTVTAGPAETVVRHTFRIPVEREPLHLTQQYVAALIQSVTFGTGARGPRALRIALAPHPELGLAHLAPHLDGELAVGHGRTTEVTFTNEALDRPYIGSRRTPFPATSEAGWAMIRGDGTLAGSIRAILPDLLAQGEASVGTLASLAYMSRRTLQRRLTTEGTSVSQLIAATRRALAIDSLDRTDAPVGDIAFQLGYNSTSSFSRAVRRWTSTSPRGLRAS